MNTVGQDHIVILQHEEENIVSVCFIRNKKWPKQLQMLISALSFVTKFMSSQEREEEWK